MPAHPTPTTTTTPNRYGTLAWTHVARWQPQRLAAIGDPQTYFTSLGEEAAEEIENLTWDLAGRPPAGEDYWAAVGRMGMARLMAEELVLAELISSTAILDDCPMDPTGAYLGHDPQMSAAWAPLWDGGEPDPT